MDTVISKHTILRWLPNPGLKFLSVSRQLLLILRPRKYRLDWCRSRTKLDSVCFLEMWSTETTPDFLLILMITIRVWRQKGQRSNTAFATERNTAVILSVKVWGAICWVSRSTLVVLQGTLTAFRYVDDTLQLVVLPILSSHQVPYISKTMLGRILRDSRNYAYRDIIYFHGLTDN